MNKRANEIDLLRFLAAMSVVLFHYAFRGYAADNLTTMPYPLLAPIAKYGYLGVELFFMISGFVILMTASNGSLKAFVASRIARLYPAFWACCTVTFAATLLIGGVRYSASLSQYMSNMSMLSNFVSVKSIDGTYWSLFIELKFYALVASLLIFRQMRRAELFLVLWLISSIMYEVCRFDFLRAMFIANYSAYFIAGAMCFLVWSRGLSVQRVVTIVVAWVLALYQAIQAIPSLDKQFSISHNPYVISVIVTACFVVLFLVAVRRTGPFARANWMTVGALTYPLYLIHHNLGFMIFNIAYPAVNPHIVLWGTVILMLGIAYVVNVCIERKCAASFKAWLGAMWDALIVRLAWGRPSEIMRDL
jgi:peptidoglycan/LPS O-acetylase OafA/YrhL